MKFSYIITISVLMGHVPMFSFVCSVIVVVVVGFVVAICLERVYIWKWFRVFPFRNRRTKMVVSIGFWSNLWPQSVKISVADVFCSQTYQSRRAGHCSDVFRAPRPRLMSSESIVVCDCAFVCRPSEVDNVETSDRASEASEKPQARKLTPAM